MKSLFVAATIGAALSIAACGGGGGHAPGPLPTLQPTPSPSPTVGAQYHLVFAISGKGQSSALQSARRMVADTSQLVQEPVEIGAQVCSETQVSCGSNFIEGSGSQYAAVTPEVVNSEGSPTPETTAPAVSISNSADASVTDSVPIQVTADTTPAQTALTVTYPNATGQLPVYVYPQLGLEYLASGDYTPGVGSEGYSFTPGTATATGASSGDLYLDSSGNLNAPNGAVFLPSTTPISTVLNCTTEFTGTPFTTVSLSTIEANSGTDAIILAKSASAGVCVKLLWTELSVQGASDFIAGLNGVSDANGNFSY